MSGFAADWLALREAADHRARDPRLRDAVAAHLAGRAHVAIVDLACGAGSNLRALAPFIAADQSWRLVDHDDRLLAAARERIGDWADRQEPAERAFCQGRTADRCFIRRRRSGAHVRNEALDGDIDLVTAAAFFDLVSQTMDRTLLRGARGAAAAALRRAHLYRLGSLDAAAPGRRPRARRLSRASGRRQGLWPRRGSERRRRSSPTALRRHGYLVSTAAIALAARARGHGADRSDSPMARRRRRRDRPARHGDRRGLAAFAPSRGRLRDRAYRSFRRSRLTISAIRKATCARSDRRSRRSMRRRRRRYAELSSAAMSRPPARCQWKSVSDSGSSFASRAGRSADAEEGRAQAIGGERQPADDRRRQQKHVERPVHGERQPCARSAVSCAAGAAATRRRLAARRSIRPSDGEAEGFVQDEQPVLRVARIESRHDETRRDETDDERRHEPVQPSGERSITAVSH